MHTYLALGDSYTIGEQVPIFESFPYKAVEILRLSGMQINAPEIVAKTGFTTDELLHQIDAQSFLTRYDFVTLLIGVNNQYRGRSVANFEEEFIVLLKKAIAFSEDPSKVIVLSIPDWGITPFAAERDGKQIAAEIDVYNEVCALNAKKHHTQFIDITTNLRVNGFKTEYLAGDQLHPSGKEYALWADQVAAKIQSLV